MSIGNLASKGFGDLLKRVPPNQVKQFLIFASRRRKYKEAVNQLSDKLPPIDWEYYRLNVRPDFVKMVDNFRIKYEELAHVFAIRHESLDYAKYYTEWEKLAAQVKEEVKQFKEASDKRIALYESEIRRIKKLMPYEYMTMEQYLMERPELSHQIPGQGKPTFWPHNDEEQCLGTAMECGGGEEQIEAKKKAEAELEKVKAAIKFAETLMHDDRTPK